MHRQFCWVLEGPSVDKEKTLAWYCSLGLRGETGSSMIAAQYQALSTVIIRGTS